MDLLGSSGICLPNIYLAAVFSDQSFGKNSKSKKTDRSDVICGH